MPDAHFIFGRGRGTPVFFEEAASGTYDLGVPPVYVVAERNLVPRVVATVAREHFAVVDGVVAGIGRSRLLRCAIPIRPYALTPEPKAAAVCGNAARTDLCGGWSAMAIPTATRTKEAKGTLRC